MFAAEWWGFTGVSYCGVLRSSIRAGDTSRLNKPISKACSVTGCKVDTFEPVERRSLNRLLAFVDEHDCSSKLLSIKDFVTHIVTLETHVSRTVFPNLLEPWRKFHIRKITRHIPVSQKAHWSFLLLTRDRIGSVCPHYTFLAFFWTLLMLGRRLGRDFLQDTRSDWLLSLFKYLSVAITLHS